MLAALEAATRDLPELAEANRLRHRGRRRLGPFRFGRGWYLQLPIESDTFAVLRDMLDRHADPERVPRATLEALRAALGDGLSPPKV